MKRFPDMTAVAAAAVLSVAATVSMSAAAVEVAPHVLTGMHELCYADPCYHPTQGVPLREIAPSLSWAFADGRVTDDARRLGIRTYAYVDPSIQYDPKRDYSPLYSEDESTFLRGCNGARAAVRRGDLTGFLMDQGSPAYRERVRSYVESEFRGRYDALFIDDLFAAHHTWASVANPPCSRSYERERDATYGLWSNLRMPVIFNGLGDAPDDGRTSAYVQAALTGPGVIGGMYEFCLTTSDAATDHTLQKKRVDGAWRSAENSHLQTVALRRYFLCYAASDTPAASPAGLDERTYVYASFLLVYRLEQSVLEMAAAGARRRVPVYPESQLVALDPLRHQPRDVDELRTADGAYLREYARCFLHGRPAGPCAAVVNPSASRTVFARVPGYAHALDVRGDSLWDHGTATVDAVAPRDLPPATGAVIFR
ncbi:MAG: hypothetical protein NVS3B7_11590 [Candidatus Elarobacter sp.]